MGVKRSRQAVTDSFRSLEIDVARFTDSRALDTPAAINEATESNIPLVGTDGNPADPAGPICLNTPS